MVLQMQDAQHGRGGGIAAGFPCGAPSSACSPQWGLAGEVCTPLVSGAGSGRRLRFRSQHAAVATAQVQPRQEVASQERGTEHAHMSAHQGRGH